MAEITTKELGCIADGLGIEQTITAKYHEYAKETQDAALKQKYEEIAQKHQKHFDALYAMLK